MPSCDSSGVLTEAGDDYKEDARHSRILHLTFIHTYHPPRAPTTLGERPPPVPPPVPLPSPASPLTVACRRKIKTHLRRRVPCRPPVTPMRNDSTRQLRPADRRHDHAAPAARNLSRSANSPRHLEDTLHPRPSFSSFVPRSNTDGNEKLFIGLVRCISVVRNF